MGALSSLSGVQFGSTTLAGGNLNEKAPSFGFNRPAPFKGPEPFSNQAIGVGESNIEHPLPFKADTANSFNRAMAWRRHGASLSYGKTSMGSTFDFSA